MSSTKHSVTDLRQMDEQTAKQTLTVVEFERWERLNDLMDGAERTREQWRDEDDRVEEIIVHADPEQLGTRLNLYGNDVLVHIDPDDRDVRAAIDPLEEEFGDTDADEVPELDDAEIERVTNLLLDLFDAVLVDWNGHRWAALDDETRQTVLDSIREKWGVEGLLLGWADVAEAVKDDREERVEVVESFR